MVYTHLATASPPRTQHLLSTLGVEPTKNDLPARKWKIVWQPEGGKIVCQIKQTQLPPVCPTFDVVQVALIILIEERVRVQCKLELTQLLSAVAVLVHADWDEDEKQRGTLNVSWN